MRLARVELIAAMILAVAMAAWAETPDFSGTWTLDSSSTPVGSGNEGGGGSALGNGPATVTQTAETLTIQRTMGGDTVTLTYRLDGTGSRNTFEGGDGRPVDSLSIVKWDGVRLTIVTKQESAGKLAEATEVWTLAGNTLTVEIASGRGAQKRIYKK
jgi:hypothetical protein